MNRNNMLESALEYTRRGYSVLPLQPRNKRPIRGLMWSEFNKRIASPDELQAWWSTYPQANIGVITGEISKVIAVDVDVGRGGSPEEIFELAPTDCITRTGTGGYHLFYRYPSGDPIGNRVGGDGIDIRGDRGYVVAPPSIHPNGRRYEWLRDGEPGIMTPSLIQRLSRDPSASDEGVSGQKWLVDVLQGVESGMRNDACARVAGYYAGKGIPLDVALTLVRNWNTYNTPPLDDGELQTTVRSIYRTRSQNTRERGETVREPDEFSVLKLEDFMLKYGAADLSWAIEGWLPEETIAFLVSPPGMYKTWILLDLAVSIAGGTPFLNQFEVNASAVGPVLIIQQEDFHGSLAERVALIINSRYGLIGEGEWQVGIPPKLPIYFHPDRKLRFDDPGVIGALAKVVEEIKPKLIILDPLYSAGSTDDYMAKTAELMMPLKDFRDKYKCSFIVAHHTKKSVEGNHREGLWGSQFLNAFLETGWQVRKGKQDDTISLLRHFKISGNSPSLNISFDISTEAPYKYEVSTSEGSDITSSQADLLGFIQQHGPSTAAEIADGIGVHRSTVSRRIGSLEEDGVIAKHGSKYSVLSQQFEI